MEQISTKYNEAVQLIKSAILQNQLEAVKAVNQQMLALYYGIGKYVSDNTRHGVWGTGAIEAISEQLRRELPGLRGFGVSNIKNMRQFYEAWSTCLNRQPMADGTSVCSMMTNVSPMKILPLVLCFVGMQTRHT